MDLLLLCASAFSVSLWLSLNAYQAQLRGHRRAMREHFERLQEAEQGGAGAGRTAGPAADLVAGPAAGRTSGRTAETAAADGGGSGGGGGGSGGGGGGGGGEGEDAEARLVGAEDLRSDGGGAAGRRRVAAREGDNPRDDSLGDNVRGERGDNARDERGDSARDESDSARDERYLSDDLRCPISLEVMVDH